MFRSYLHCFSVFVWTDEKASNTLRVDAYFVENRKKIRIHVDGAQVAISCPLVPDFKLLKPFLTPCSNGAIHRVTIKTNQ